jgi:hypothetical protein
MTQACYDSIEFSKDLIALSAGASVCVVHRRRPFNHVLSSIFSTIVPRSGWKLQTGVTPR